MCEITSSCIIPLISLLKTIMADFDDKEVLAVAQITVVEALELPEIKLFGKGSLGVPLNVMSLQTIMT
ncbi:hypothetical protein Pcinc_008671 [Petrolisthes cinctipes]|uniref:Uncharacterized protein n=1 Tax=Petrolisthes cinctipes TaxID=88211 RepID=A0AAE1G6V4_PETCI|nr:hypothetical protein Pcinc_008671 [Petrolisthes cinctipes]KAK3887190.1 hypothetical protein Pcinc_008671 [Petrolisthes cinctipes]